MSALEDTLFLHMRLAGIPVPQREFRFAPPRRWKFDFCWPDLMLYLEVEGGTWVNGRHSRGIGMRNDAEKYNQASLLGWTGLRATADMVKDGSALAVVEEAFFPGSRTRRRTGS